MNFQILFFYLLFIVGAFGKILRIVGGRNAEIKEFPFLVSLTFTDNNKHTCGGAIIAKCFILTAAHCVYNKQHFYKHLVVYTGTTSLKNRTGEEYRVKNVHIHPEFTAKKSKEVMNRHDIAVLEIEGCIKYNEYQKKANLPTSDVRSGENAMIAGWGLTDFPSIIYPDQLQKVTMKILDNSVCAKKVPFDVHEDQLCAFEKAGVGVCVGDSGGPLVVNNEIVAIISISLPCGTGLPDIFTRIYPHLDFIKSIVPY